MRKRSVNLREELPEGWTVQFNALKAGRQIKCYLNTGTGQKFFSKDDLMRYIKAQSRQPDQPQLTKQQVTRHPETNLIDMNTKCERENSVFATENEQMHTNQRQTKGEMRKRRIDCQKVAEASLPEEVPEGWTVQSKVLKTGRQIKCFVNNVTGQRFFSKDDLICHIKAQSHQPQLTKQHVMKHPKTNEMHHVEDTNKLPDWLPSGWIVEQKIRNDGKSSGQGYKVYVDLSTGRKFYSKPQVLHHLAAVKHKSHKPKLKKCVRHSTNVIVDPSTGCRFNSKPQVLHHGKAVKHKIHKTKMKNRVQHPCKTSEPGYVHKTWVIIERSTVEDLPPGWTREIKVRKNGKRDPFYTDPVTGYVFCSRRAVERYLDTGEISRHACLPKKRHFNDDSLVSPAAKNQKLEHPSARRQLFSGKRSSHAGSIAPRETETLRKAGCETVHTETAVPIASAAEIPSAECVKGKNSDVCKSVPEKAEVLERSQDNEVFVDDRSFLISEDGVELEETSLDNWMERGSRSKGLTISCKSEKKKWLESPRRFSKRLAGLEPELVASTVSTVQALQNAERVCEKEIVLALGSLSGEASQQLHHCSMGTNNLCKKCDKNISFSTPKADTTLEQNSLGTELKNEARTVIQNNVSQYNKSRGFNLPRRYSERLAQLKPQLVIDSASGRPACQNLTEKSVSRSVPSAEAPQNVVKPCKNEACVVMSTTSYCLSSESSPCLHAEAANHGTKLPSGGSDNVTGPLRRGLEKKSQKFLPNQGVQVKQSFLGTCKSTDKNSDSPLSCLPGQFLSDPCLEFAFKTLTGAMPVGTAEIMGEQNLPITSMEKSRQSKSLGKSSRSKNSKELNLTHRSSKRLPGFQLEQMASPLSSEFIGVLADEAPHQLNVGLGAAQTHQGAACKTLLHKKLSKKGKEGLHDLWVSEKQLQLDFGKMLYNKPEHETFIRFGDQPSVLSLEFVLRNCKGDITAAGPNRCGSADMKTKPLKKPSNKGKKALKAQTVAEKQSQLDFEKMHCYKPEQQPFSSSEDYCSDPAVEFALQNLTGEVLLDDNFIGLGYCQPQNNPSQDSSLPAPDVSLPSSFQTDFSARLDTPLKQPAFCGNDSLPSCSSIGAQQPQVERSKELGGQVNP